MDSMKSGAIVMTIIALLIGGGFGYALGNGMSDDDKTSDSSMMMDDSSAVKEGVVVGGALMVKDKDIVDNAVNAPNVSTVVSLVKLADLVDTLKGTGPFTVFAPNNGAFEKLPTELVETLQKPESKDTLAGILTYHVVPGTYTSADLVAMASSGMTLTTVQGGTLSFRNEGGMVKVVDATGAAVEIETSDVISSNGVTHVIKSVLMQ